MSGDDANSPALDEGFGPTGSRSSIGILASSSTSMAVRVCGLGLGFLAHIVLSRILGASQYGSYVIALGWAMVLVIPARLGLDNSVLRFATIYREEGRAADLRGLVRFSLACMGALSLIIASCLLIAKAAGTGSLRSVDWVMLAGIALLIPFSAVLGWLSTLVRTANRIFAAQFYEQVLRPALLIAALVALMLAGLRLDAPDAMLITAATVAAAMIGIAVQTKAVFRSVPRVHASFGHRREWLSVSWVRLRAPMTGMMEFRLASTQARANCTCVIPLLEAISRRRATSF